MMRTAGVRRVVVLSGWLVLCGLALAGCREDEQNRLLTLEKGRYPGEVERTTTTPEVAEALNERAMTQQF